jgi:Astacin (Peptidase family M12A)
MHYGRTAFSIDGSDTIITLKDVGGETLGQRVKISEKDAARMNSAYCGGPILTTTVSSKPTTPNPIVEAINEWIKDLLRNIFGGNRT